MIRCESCDMPPNRRLGRISGWEAESIKTGSWPAPWLCIAFLFPQRWGLLFETDRFVASLRLLRLFSAFAVARARKVLRAQRQGVPVVPRGGC